MKQLIIAEKPSVARDLAKVLGATNKQKSYIEGPSVIVTWALGHLLGLKMPEDYNPAWATWTLETLPMLPKKMGIKPLPKTDHQLKAISHLANRKDVGEVVIATDAGREGELVARWILEYIKYTGPVKRLWISSQTDKAIRTGFTQLAPSKKYDALYQSALARAEADWLVGLNVTRALTVKYADNLSAGRVQTPTLAMVRQQEQVIEKFKPQQYYTIDLIIQGLKGQLQLESPQSITERNTAEKIVANLRGQTVSVTEIKEKQHKEVAPLPYDLTEIQREANQRYGFSAKKTLSLVQSLYEVHKVVTYPRTDSKYLTTDMQSTMRERLQAVVAYRPSEAKAILAKGAKVKVTKVFQDSRVTDHHALIPTEQMVKIEKLSNDEQKIYALIVDRFLGLFADPFESVQQTVWMTAKQSVFVFKQTKIIALGWKKQPQENPLKVVSFEKGQSYLAEKLVINQAVTKPAKPLNEAALLGKMEKHNLGTPATRAEIIEKLVKSELMERAQQSLVVTRKGKQLLTLVNPSLVSPELTTKWEIQLEEIAKGKASKDTFIASIQTETKRLVSEIKKSQVTYTDFSITTKTCPDCQSPLKEKNSRDGKIYVCTNETCSYRRRKDPKVSNKRCPQCHRKMEIHAGKNGDFFKCKYCVITEKVPTKQAHKKKLSKQEEKRLLKKYSQTAEPTESPLALALKAAMNEEKND